MVLVEYDIRNVLLQGKEVIWVCPFESRSHCSISKQSESVTLIAISLWESGQTIKLSLFAGWIYWKIFHIYHYYLANYIIYLYNWLICYTLFFLRGEATWNEYLLHKRAKYDRPIIQISDYQLQMGRENNIRPIHCTTTLHLEDHH